LGFRRDCGLHGNDAFFYLYGDQTKEISLLIHLEDSAYGNKKF
jgi:hypothetical protein